MNKKTKEIERSSGKGLEGKTVREPYGRLWLQGGICGQGQQEAAGQYAQPPAAGLCQGEGYQTLS